MPRIFKATYKDRRGKSHQSAKWYMELKGPDGRIMRLAGFKDKGATDETARKLETLVACSVARRQPPPELSRWLEGLPNRLLRRLSGEQTRARAGRWQQRPIHIIDPQSVAGCKPIAEHIEDFARHMANKGNTPDHVVATKTHVTLAMQGASIHSINSVQPARIADYLAARRRGTKNEPGIGLATSNHQLTSIKTFFKWLVKERRIGENPVEHLTKLNAKTDRRRIRRGLSESELQHLIAYTRTRPRRFKMSGPQRALCYHLVAESGLRASEVCSLTRQSFTFDRESTVTVLAAYSKRKRDDVLPLRPETATMLRKHVESLPPAGIAFPLPHNAARVLREDMRKAREAWLGDKSVPDQVKEQEPNFLLPADDAGRVVDFHALRHTFLTNLAAGKVHPKTAQELARHSSITLTMDIYTHVGRADLSAALRSLPSLCPEPQKPENQAAKATGTDCNQPPPPDACFTECFAGKVAPASAAVHQFASGLNSTAAGVKTGKSRNSRSTMRIPIKKDQGPTAARPPGLRTRCPGHPNATPAKITACDPPSGRSADCFAETLENEPELARLVEVWPDLPPAVKAGILAMVKASGGAK